MELQQQFEEYIQRITRSIPGADEQVLKFIMDFSTCTANTEEQYEIIRSLFRAGYCWHFAHLLKTTFGKGEVCVAAPFGHFVWKDDNDVTYDIEGVYCGEAFYFIPESYLGDALQDFMHIPGVNHNANEDEIMGIIHQYEDDNNLPHDETIRRYLQP